MEGKEGPDFWLRFRKTTGWMGCLAFLLVFWSASLGGAFNWLVFAMSGAAVLLCWFRASMLVPEHLRHADAEDKMWSRFYQSDWRFVDSFSDLSGAEIDALRSIFSNGDDAAARAFIAAHWPTMTEDDRKQFLRFFCDVFMDSMWCYIDDTGRLQPVD